MDTSLTENQKVQLDGIVQKMTANKESRSNIQFVVDDFKKKYAAPAANAPGPLDSFQAGGRAILDDIAGKKQNESQSFIPSVIQSTIGSKGLAGVAQLPGRVAAQPAIIAQTTANDARVAELAKQAGDAFAKANKTTDPAQKEKLLKIGKQMQANAQQLSAANAEEEKNIITPGQAAGTALNAALTVGTGEANLLGKASPALKTLSKGTSFINPVARSIYYGGRLVENAALGAGFNTANNLANNKPVTDNLAASTILGAALPLAGHAASAATEAVTSKLAPASEALINSLIKPLQKDFAYGKNPARGILNEGIIAKDLPSLGAQVNDKLSTIGEQIGTVGTQINDTGVKLDLSPSLNPIDQAMRDAAKSNNPTLLNSLNNVRIALTHDLGLKIDESGTPIISKGNPKNLTGAGYKDAVQFLSDIRDHTRFTGNPSDDKALNAATKAAYGITRGIMNTTADGVSPEVGTTIRNLNERYADLSSAKSAITHRDLVAKRQNLISLAGKFSIPVAIAGALLSGNLAHAGVILATEVGGLLAGKALGSATTKTRVAQFLMRLAPEERQSILNSTPVLKSWYERLTGNKSPGKDTPKTKALNAAQTYLKNPKMGLSVQDVSEFNYAAAAEGLNNTGRSAIMDFIAGDKEVDKAFIQNIATHMDLPHALHPDKSLREDFIKVMDADRAAVKAKLKK